MTWMCLKVSVPSGRTAPFALYLGIGYSFGSRFLPPIHDTAFRPRREMADLKALIAEKETAVIKSAAAPGDAAPASITKHVPTIAIADGKARRNNLFPSTHPSRLVP